MTSRTHWWERPAPFAVAMVTLVAVFATSAEVRDRVYAGSRVETRLLYIQDGEVLTRMALSFDVLLADVYWIRALQHYGGTKRSEDGEKRYDLLGPLLDIATTLDPRFNAVYRFGAIFLTEGYPNGPGQPDLAIALLQKGIEEMPDKWEYYMDIGFIYYWWLQDYDTAAAWFEKAADVPGASWWLRSLAANTLATGGSRASSRRLWQQMYDTADNDWIRNESARRLTQLRALDDIDELIGAAQRFIAQSGRPPRSWEELIEAGLLAGFPVDPTGRPYVIDGTSGTINVSSDSELFPLPGETLPPS
ncbi:MAG: tetratricopeptide repeat protein [Acidobacteria bacterium]|nr:tetratricopeptide repeat protein [Acidobacteriota bacterium]TDI22844.1 MAG: tetratricopeptide repeat protein [Acidobacteriota bacterium]